ncbi:MAG: hypothetical protein J0L95_11170, partial [Candidatus Accumulibacter sp.]|uniref:hypothetical protein n=1 Tax=Accumulibacter sp. TaxID=2053492 RepID=UPI001AD155E3
LAAVQARPLLRLPHLVSLAKSQPRLIHDPGRTPKNTQTAKKTSDAKPTNPEENPVSCRQV